MKKALFFLAVLLILWSEADAQQKAVSRSTDPFIVEALELIRGDSLMSYMQALQDFETRYFLAPNRKEVATWIMNKFLSFGVPEVSIDSFLFYIPIQNDTTTWQYNVIAKIPGMVYPDFEVVVMGHYDSTVNPWSGNPMDIAPGADDNASGVAAALECARVMMEMGYSPERSIVFLATATEEYMYDGNSGATQYAQQVADQNRKLGMVINNDMIAYNEDSWRVIIVDDPHSAYINFMATEVIENYTSLNFSFNNFVGYCDLEPFIDLGYSGIFFIEDYPNQMNPYYHTINDVVDHLDTAYHAEITRVSLGLLLHYETMTTEAALAEILMPAANCSGSLNPVFKVRNLGSDTITSMDFICIINSLDTVVFSWMGTIPFLENGMVELPNIPFTLLDENEIKVVIETVNGLNDQYSDNNSMSFGFGKAIPTPSEIKLRLRLDNKPEEITWEIRNNEGEIVFSGGPYPTPNIIINITMNFDELGCYTFTINDAGGDGLNAPGHFLLYYSSNTHILYGINFGSQSQTQFDVGNTLFVIEPKELASVRLHPNPVQDYGFIELDLNSASVVEVVVYNLFGQQVYNLAGQHYEPGTHLIIIDAGNLNPGMYIVSIRLDDELFARRIIKY
jgi:hypothetical protein